MLFLNEWKETFTEVFHIRNLSRPWRMAGIVLKELVKFLLLYSIAIYRMIGTLFVGGACRFEPSCSSYAMVAVQRFSPQQALVLIIRRLLKCRPGGPFGFDPVPPIISTSIKLERNDENAG
jgi:uncharacterized protein